MMTFERFRRSTDEVQRICFIVHVVCTLGLALSLPVAAVAAWRLFT